MMPRFGLELVASPGLEQLVVVRPRARRNLQRPRVRARRRLSLDRDRRVGGVRAAAGERQQDRRAVGRADQRAGHRPAGRRAAAAERRRAPRQRRRHRAGALLDRPAEARRRPTSISTGADGRRRHRQLDEARVPDGRVPHRRQSSRTRTASACCRWRRRRRTRPRTPPREWIDPATGLPHRPALGGARQHVALLPPERLHRVGRQAAHRGAGRPGDRRPEDARRRARRHRARQPRRGGAEEPAGVLRQGRRRLRDAPGHEGDAAHRAATPRLRSGSGLAVNATETLLAGSLVEPGAPPAPRGGGLEARWAARLPMAIYTIDIASGADRRRCTGAPTG